MKTVGWFMKPLLAVVLILVSVITFAQTPTDSLPGDPGGISVYTMQNMCFGAFSQGASGGTVVLSNGGSRSATGTVVTLNLGVAYFQALFAIEAPVGTIISVLNGPSATLSGSNGGTMILNLGSSSPSAPFSTTASPPGRTQVDIGGTLTVGNQATTPAGSYSGTFYITFNQE